MKVDDGRDDWFDLHPFSYSIILIVWAIFIACGVYMFLTLHGAC